MALVQPDGIVSRLAFVDEDIYRLEMERVFHRCWLFLAHTSMLPKPGDYLATYTGEDPVVVWRDSTGRVRAFLNTCPHRGNKLCLADRGPAAALTCSYHGWTFTSEGKLTGVPFFERAYYGQLDRERLGLVEMPCVSEYAGLIFGTWASSAAALDEYLGELRWWLDALYPDMEAVPGCQRYAMAGNWKLTADNFTGDGYHVPLSHSSVFKLAESRAQRVVMNRSVKGREDDQPPYGMFGAALAGGHGLGGIMTDHSLIQNDLRQAEQLGPHVLDFVNDYYARVQSRMGDLPDKPTGFNFGNCFPNLQFQGSGAFQGQLVIVVQPRGPHRSEIWQWLLVDRCAPPEVRRLAAINTAQRQSAAGLVGVDDGENFERIAEVARAPKSRELTFHYGMALEHEDRWPDSAGWHTTGLPGRISPRYSEVNQRAFYRRWAEQMELE